MQTTEEERLIRELILQMKLGRVSQQYFRDKYRVNVGERFHQQFDDLQRRGLLTFQGDWIVLDRQALLRVGHTLERLLSAATSSVALHMTCRR